MSDSSTSIPHGNQLPRLTPSHPPLQTYYYVAFGQAHPLDAVPHHIVAYRVVWDVPLIWEAVLKQLVAVTGTPNFVCWLDSYAGDAFLEENRWQPVLCDGVLEHNFTFPTT